ncbi:unnamed protein product, partial [Prorocentrum cordatum]
MKLTRPWRFRLLRDKLTAENLGREAKNRIWCDVEAPIEVRVYTGFLRNLRNQLVEWKYSQKSVKIDRDAGALKVQGEEVVQVKVINYEFIITWMKEEWKTWDELQKSRELELLVRTSKERSFVPGLREFRPEPSGKPVLKDSVVCGFWNVKGLTDLTLIGLMGHMHEYHIYVL